MHNSPASQSHRPGTLRRTTESIREATRTGSAPTDLALSENLALIRSPYGRITPLASQGGRDHLVWGWHVPWDALGDQGREYFNSTHAGVKESSWVTPSLSFFLGGVLSFSLTTLWRRLKELMKDVNDGVLLLPLLALLSTLLVLSSLYLRCLFLFPSPRLYLHFPYSYFPESITHVLFTSCLFSLRSEIYLHILTPMKVDEHEKK